MAWVDSFAPGLFDGRTALVTGATSGIGLAVAQGFAALGATVHALGRRAHQFRERIVGHRVDVTDAAALEAAVGALDGLDFLVTAAGMARPYDEHDPAVFEETLALNLTATMRVCTLARPLLAEARGSIVTLSSMYATFGNPRAPGYASSKGGVDALTRSLAVAYAPDGIRVNGIAPGWVETPLLDRVRAAPGAEAAILARTPMARFGAPDEVVAAAAFLCSPAAAFMTGAILPVDGGYRCA